MNRNVLMIAACLTVLAVGGVPADAQTTNAEIRTWAGEVYQLADPSLEVLYTIMVKKAEESEPADGAATTGAKSPTLFGTASAIGKFLDKQPDPLLGNRQSDTIMLRKDGAEIRLPLASIGALFFARQRAHSTLPPYVASNHYRYSATAVLSDGSRIEADYVSLGTTVFRGRTAHGRVDIPWQHIEVVRFTR